MPKIRIHNLETGEIIDREATQAEIDGVPNPNGLKAEQSTPNLAVDAKEL
jgi:hypothetical protein